MRSSFVVASAFAATLCCAACATDSRTPAEVVDESTRIAPIDTGAGIPASMHIHGLTQVVTRVSGSGNDTLGFTPLGGVQVTLYHNVLQNGLATQVTIARTETKSDGSFDFGVQRGGYYVLTAIAPSGTSLGPATVLVELRADADTRIFLNGAQQTQRGTSPSDPWSLGARLSVMAAFAGSHADVDDAWTEYTEEGAPITYRIHATKGRVDLERDARADGGGDERYVLTNIALFRYTPSLWSGEVEIEKERVDPVEPSDAAARPEYRYYLHGQCAPATCDVWF